MNSAACTTLKTRARHAYLITALISIALIGIATVVAYSWRLHLPAQIAAHWNAAGEPTRTTTFIGFMLPWWIGGLLTTALFTGLGWALGSQAMIRKSIAAVNIWAGLYFGSLMLSGLWFQRSLRDGTMMNLNSALLGIPIVISGVGAALTWFLIPGDPPMPTNTPIPENALRVSLPSNQLAVWHRQVSGRNALIMVALCGLLMAALAHWMNMWIMWVLTGLIALTSLAMLSFVVRVDAAGLTVRSVLGLPRTRIPLNEIVRASVAEVNPMGDFGGWGWRTGLGGDRTGVVLRTGEALKVERTGGRLFFITTDDAAGAAALLNTLADRARG